MDLPKSVPQAEAEPSRKAAVTFDFTIPCFAHQQLDPMRFPEGKLPPLHLVSYHIMLKMTNVSGVGSAIGGPLSWANVNLRLGGSQGAWEDSDDGEDMGGVDEAQVKVCCRSGVFTMSAMHRRRTPQSLEYRKQSCRRKVFGRPPYSIFRLSQDTPLVSY